MSIHFDQCLISPNPDTSNHQSTLCFMDLIFSDLDFFFFFYSLIAVARTFRNMLNNSDESGHPCLVPDLRGNAFSFSPLRIMFAVGLSHMAFTVLT